MTILKMNESLLEQCFEAEEYDLKPLFEMAFELSRKKFSEDIIFYSPGMIHYQTEFHEATDPFRFPSISITGNSCAIGCEHCRGRLLESMIHATTPEDLWRICEEIVRKGGSGCLISGGSTSRGNTPLEQFIPIIERVKSDLDLNVVVHTGIVYPEIAEELGRAGIDGAMLDIIGSHQTLEEIYHLDMPVSIFEDSMRLLNEYNVPMMPHIIAGLYHGKLNGEDQAIRMIGKYNPDSIVIVAFMPLDDTPMEKTNPATPMDIARVVLGARLYIQDRPVVLGCARPLGLHRRSLDRLAIDAGVNAIAYPTEEGYSYAKKRNLSIGLSDQCCSLITKKL